MTFKKISCNSIIDPNQLHDYLNEQLKKDHILKEFKQTFSHLDTTQFWDQAKQNPQAYYDPLKEIATFLSNSQKNKKQDSTPSQKSTSSDDALTYYTNNIQQSGTWGSELEIWAIALKKGYCIKVCHNLKSLPKQKKKSKSVVPKVDTEYGVSVFGNPNSKKVIKLYFKNNHYMAVNVSDEIINISDHGDCLFSSIAYSIEGKDKYRKDPHTLDIKYRNLAASEIQTKFWEKRPFLNLLNDDQKTIFNDMLKIALTEI